MLLSELLPGAPAAEVAGLAYDSRQVKPGYVFELAGKTNGPLPELPSIAFDLLIVDELG